MAPKDPKLELLRSIPLFAGLGGHELQRLGQLTDEIDVPAGKVLMRQGEHGAEAFIIAGGRVAVERDGGLIAERGPGEVLGEIAILSEGPRTATVTTTEPSRLFVIGHREFHALMSEMPAIRLQVLDVLARRIRSLDVGTAH